MVIILIVFILYKFGVFLFEILRYNKIFMFDCLIISIILMFIILIIIGKEVMLEYWLLILLL